MNNETRLILENQQAIMNVVNYIMVYVQADGSGDLQRQIIDAYNKTKEALTPKENDLEKRREKAVEEKPMTNFNLSEIFEKRKKKLRSLLIYNSKCKCINLTDKYGNISDMVLSELEGDIKKFIKECIEEFYGNDKYEYEIRTPIEARDILIEKAGDKLK